VAATLRKTNALDELKAQHGDRLWVESLEPLRHAHFR
jgi:hypothetical protein